MSRLIAIVLLVAIAALVSACGVDGEPEQPDRAPETGVTVSGNAIFGVTF